MYVDLLVLLEPRVHGTPIEPEVLGELVDLGRSIPAGRRHRLCGSGLHRVELGLAARRRTVDVTGGDQQVGTDVVGREVVGGVVRLLPYELDAASVGDRGSAQLDFDALGAVFDADAAMGASRHRAPFRRSSHQRRRRPRHSADVERAAGGVPTARPRLTAPQAGGPTERRRRDPRRTRRLPLCDPTHREPRLLPRSVIAICGSAPTADGHPDKRFGRKGPCETVTSPDERVRRRRRRQRERPGRLAGDAVSVPAQLGEPDLTHGGRRQRCSSRPPGWCLTEASARDLALRSESAELRPMGSTLPPVLQ